MGSFLCHSYPCIFLPLMHKTTKVLIKIQFMTSIKRLHVSAPECRPQGAFYNKAVQAQNAILGTASPPTGVIKILKF
jgi:hypothetical protein